MDDSGFVDGELVVRNPRVDKEEYEELTNTLNDDHWVWDSEMRVRESEPDSDGEIEVYKDGGDEDDYIFIFPHMVITLDERSRIIKEMKDELLEMAEEINE